MASYLITGCSRGLGLKLVQKLLEKPSSSVETIFATARSEQPSQLLQDVISVDPSRVKYVRLDVEDPASIELALAQVHKELGQKGLDVLINNAGIQYAEIGGARRMDFLQQTLSTNVVAVHRVSTAFLPLLQVGQQKKVVNISSTLGSISMKDAFALSPFSSYKISKAALNMLTVQYSLDLANEGFIVAAISPGWLKTDLGGPDADLDPEHGAAATVDIIDNLTRTDNGAFKNIYISGHAYYDGTLVPW